MQEMNAVYRELGISSEVLAYGNKIEKELKERFDSIDENAEYNQMKVLLAMQKNKVSEACLYASSGYGYNDLGRDTLEDVYADAFHAEAALVRPQIACGTHALAVALSGNLRPGDELFSLWESPTTLWKRLSASVPPEVLWQNTESLTDRQICFLTAVLIMKISKRQ